MIFHVGCSQTTEWQVTTYSQTNATEKRVAKKSQKWRTKQIYINFHRTEIWIRDTYQSHVYFYETDKQKSIRTYTPKSLSFFGCFICCLAVCVCLCICVCVWCYSTLLRCYNGWTMYESIHDNNNDNMYSNAFFISTDDIHFFERTFLVSWLNRTFYTICILYII